MSFFVYSPGIPLGDIAHIYAMAEDVKKHVTTDCTGESTAVSQRKQQQNYFMINDSNSLRQNTCSTQQLSSYCSS